MALFHIYAHILQMYGPLTSLESDLLRMEKLVLEERAGQGKLSICAVILYVCSFSVSSSVVDN